MEKLPLYPHLLELAIEILDAKNEYHNKTPSENEMHRAQYLADGFEKIIDRQRTKYPYLKDEDQIIEAVDFMTAYCSIHFSEDFFKWFEYTFKILINVSTFQANVNPNTRAFQFVQRIHKTSGDYLDDWKA
ncbi:MAG: hypothetical protein KDC83_04315 [Flavobacteriales bacterium]|nr:hypothetical protein [Flavobacteriales bacterium]